MLLHTPERRDTDSHKWRRYAGSGIIPAWVADMDFVVADPILQAMEERLHHGVFGYSDPPPAMAETAAAYFSRRWGWEISPEWLVWLPGLGAAIHAVCRLAAADGAADIITPSPIYHVFRRAPAIAGARRIDAKMEWDGKTWRLPTATLAAAITPQTKLVQLCNPHNPNGKVYEKNELLELGEFCLRHQLPLCADEVHADLILDDDKKHCCIAALSPDIAELTITLQSPSKAFNVAGLNFAVAVIPGESLRRRFREALRGKTITHLNSFGIAAAQAAWSFSCEEWLAAVIAQLRQNRDTLAAAVADLPALSMPHLSSTYLAWLNVHRANIANPSAYFENAGVGMSAGADFGDNDYMRLNFACNPDLLNTIIKRIKQSFDISK